MYQNEIYVVGGYGGREQRFAEVYNLKNRVWREIQLMKQARYLPTMAVVNGYLGVYGGQEILNSSMEVYTEEGWVENRLKYYHHGHAGVIIQCNTPSPTPTSTPTPTPTPTILI